jgi:NAD(P)H-hydrate epimerase
MLGAPALSALAALRAGGGLCKVAAPLPIVDAAISICPGSTGIGLPVDADGEIVAHEAAAALDDIVATCDCLAVGPGLGRGEGPRAVALRAVQQEDVPAVVDADAINALAETPQLARDLRGAVVLTPHPGEFKRLVRGMGMSGDLGLDQSRERAAEQLAQRLACIVVLKGAGTVVTDGVRTWTNTSGHPCLATAGTGDVLTGMIASFVAQFVKPVPTGIPAAMLAKMPKDPAKPLDLYDAVRCAVHAHGKAAEAWAEARGSSAGMLATELTECVPLAVEAMRR